MLNKLVLFACLIAVLLSACATNSGKNYSAMTPNASGEPVANVETLTSRAEAPSMLAWDLSDDDNDGVRNRDDECPDSVPGQIIVRSGCPEPPHGVPSRVNFDPESDVLRPDTIAILNENIALLKSYKGRIEVVGHSDSCGTSQSRQDISVRRSQAVANYLFSQGVHSSQIARIYGIGDSRPLENRPANDCRSEYNRRVELIPQ